MWGKGEERGPTNGFDQNTALAIAPPVYMTLEQFYLSAGLKDGILLNFFCQNVTCEWSTVDSKYCLYPHMHIRNQHNNNTETPHINTNLFGLSGL